MRITKRISLTVHGYDTEKKKKIAFIVCNKEHAYSICIQVNVFFLLNLISPPYARIFHCILPERGWTMQIFSSVWGVCRVVEWQWTRATAVSDTMFVFHFVDDLVAHTHNETLILLHSLFISVVKKKLCFLIMFMFFIQYNRIFVSSWQTNSYSSFLFFQMWPKYHSNWKRTWAPSHPKMDWQPVTTSPSVSAVWSSVSSMWPLCFCICTWKSTRAAIPARATVFRTRWRRVIFRPTIRWLLAVASATTTIVRRNRSEDPTAQVDRRGAVCRWMDWPAMKWASSKAIHCWNTIRILMIMLVLLAMCHTRIRSVMMNVPWTMIWWKMYVSHIPDGKIGEFLW